MDIYLHEINKTMVFAILDHLHRPCFVMVGHGFDETIKTVAPFYIRFSMVLIAWWSMASP